MRKYISRNVRRIAEENFAYTNMQAPCGKPALLTDLTSEEISLAELLGIKAENLLCCPTVGDSMEDEGVREGDILFADKSLTAKLGDVVLAEIDGELAVKKIDRTPSQLRLVSCNSQNYYKPIIPKYGFHVIGVVVGSFRFRR